MCVTLQGQQSVRQSKTKIFWEKKGVNFNDTPFTIDKNILYDCQYGDHYFKRNILDLDFREHEKLAVQHTFRV